MDGGTDLTDPSRQKKRRRPALACEQCRRRKVRCDRRLPCSTCVRTNHVDCTYVPLQKVATPDRGFPKQADPVSVAKEFGLVALHEATSGVSELPAILTPGHSTRSDPWVNDEPIPQTAGHFSIADSSPDDHSGPADFGLWQPVRPVSSLAARGSRPKDALLDRIRQLEQQVADLKGQCKHTGVDLLEDGIAPSVGLKYSRGSVSKTRFFGQSHWMNSADMVCSMLHDSDMLYRLGNIARKLETDETSQICHDLRTCKNLGRLIKSRRTPKFNTITIGENVPTRELADTLIDCYLRTFESIHRILHIPSFKADYEQYWKTPTELPDHFLILMQLCMAIGATFHDELFTLRTQAIHWFWEGMVWLLTPCEKSRMTIVGLQIRCLLHYVRQTANIGSDLTWIGASSLVSTAMYMGLHRDPKNLVKMTPYRAEMRRRLWVTILEICLQSSIDAGGPPSISIPDYDTEMPANVDDECLIEGVDMPNLRSKPDSAFTQMTIPLALFRTFPTRLAIAKRVNELRSDTIYEETLRQSGELRKTLQSLMKELKAHPETSSFQLRFIQLATHRLFFALHHPITPLAKSNPLYSYSRMICMEIALRICQSAYLLPEKSSDAIDIPAQQSDTDFRRLTVNASGSFRSVPIQSALVIGLEIINQKEAETRNRPTMPLMIEPELHRIFESYADWSRSRIQSGETNIKGHSIGVLLQAHFDAFDSDLTEEETERLFERSCSERVTECLGLLRELAGITVHEESFDELEYHDTDMDFDFGAGLFGAWEWDPMDGVF
ncbi:unnamed protein product [Clonostachys rosea f. rosea IK726]|uniref:Uncharacterized protein n=1 Tax=Clonostachys rosea f. rosea IK726 TaxID=1349383 RepID=A0ACA9UQU9_BIOOC|nr:unnamed protein product [Clonostachys rosea f. rosea IK726]